MKPEIQNLIEREFVNWQKIDVEQIDMLNSGSASTRKYYRLSVGDNSFIATYNQDIRENEAFFYLGEHFRNQGINIPELYHISVDRKIYFQQDIGDICLLQKLKEEGLTEEVKGWYKESLKMLLQMQTSTHGLDYSFCYPRPAFDQQSILWDLNYFKYYFLKVSGLDFDEQLLEDDFQKVAQNLAVNEEPFFMFRDFQARNIHLFDGKPWFIDFQGGRRGPLLYDVASLLYQASAQLPDDFRKECLNDYYQKIPREFNYSRSSFEQDFKNILLIRIVQVLGAYGFRGIIEGKPYFKNSIPAALENLELLLPQFDGKVDISYFLKILHGLVQIKNNFDD